MKRSNKLSIVCLILVFTLLLSVSISGLCQEKVIKWRLQSFGAAADVTFLATVKFAALVTEASGGRLEVTSFPSGAIAPAGKEFEGVISGSVEAAHASPGWAVGYVPAGVFYTSSVATLTGNQMMMWMEYEGLKFAQELYAPVGLHYVGQLTVHPAEVFLHTNKPLRSVEDIQGLKIRLGTTALNSIFKEMGATPVFLPGGEIYEGMQRGIIDAFEYFTPSGNWAMGFQEIIKYLYLSPSRSPSDGQSLFVNKKKWDELPADLQLIVEMCAYKIAHEFHTEVALEDSIAIEKFKEYGIIVEKAPQDIVDLLYEKADEYFAAEAAKDPEYAKIYNSVLNFRKICEQIDIR